MLFAAAGKARFWSVVRQSIYEMLSEKQTDDDYVKKCMRGLMFALNRAE